MNCESYNSFAIKPMFGAVCICVFLLGMVSLILILNYFFAIVKMYKGIRDKYIEKDKEIHDQSIKKVRLPFLK